MKLCTRVFAMTIVLLVALSTFVPAQNATPAYLQVRSVPHGTVQSVEYKSKALDTDRKLVVYTPPGYESSVGRRYPILYLLHGAGSDQTSWTERGRAHVILDNLIADGKLKPLIVAMPFGFAVQRAAGARGDAAENKMQRDGFTKDFLQDVIPFVESKFRVYADRDHRAIGGLSLGGAQSLALGLTHLDLFSRIAAFSPAMGAANNPSTGGVDFEAVLTESARINEQLKLLWVGCGTEDTLFDSIRDFTQQLSKHKVEHMFRVTGGAHTYAVWQRYLNEVAPQLFPES